MESNIENIAKPEKEPVFEIDFYNVDKEFESIRRIYENIDWYKEHKYEPRLPNHSKFKEIDEISNKKDVDWGELKSIFANEIYKADYAADIEKIKKQESFLKEVVTRLKSLKERYRLEIFPTYEIIFKTYGMGGSYDVGTDRGRIILRKNDNPNFNYGITCIHEMVHIGIEKNIVQKYSNLSQPAKERLVDLIVRIEFGDMVPGYIMQTETADDRIDEFILDEKTGKFVEDIESGIAEFVRKFPKDKKTNK